MRANLLSLFILIKIIVLILIAFIFLWVTDNYVIIPQLQFSLIKDGLSEKHIGNAYRNSMDLMRPVNYRKKEQSMEFKIFEKITSFHFDSP